MTNIETHSVATLLEDLPAEGLVRGQVGIVVADWAPGVHEVEFVDNKGQTYAMLDAASSRTDTSSRVN